MNEYLPIRDSSSNAYHALGGRNYVLPDGQPETNDCVVRSLAVAAGIHYTKAHGACARRGRVNRKGFWVHKLNGALVTNRQLNTEALVGRTEGWIKADRKLHAIALANTKPTPKYVFAATGYGSVERRPTGETERHVVKAPTWAQVSAALAGDGKRYIACTRDHAFAVINGRTPDKGVSARHRVVELTEVFVSAIGAEAVA